MKMKAAVVFETADHPFTNTTPLKIEEVDLDPPGPGEVLVKVLAAGLCHSDLSAIEGMRPRKMPYVPGHEAAGIVEEVGAGGDAGEAGRSRHPVLRAELRHLHVLRSGGAVSLRHRL